MDFFARLASIRSTPSRSDDARVVTRLMLEVHDIPTDWLTQQLGGNLTCHVEGAAAQLSPIERAINATMDTTPTVGGEVVIEDEPAGTVTVDGEVIGSRTTNGATARGRRR